MCDCVLYVVVMYLSLYCGYIVNLDYYCSSCSCVCCYLEVHRSSCLVLKQGFINDFLTSYKTYLITDSAFMQRGYLRTSSSRTVLKATWSLHAVGTRAGFIFSDIQPWKSPSRCHHSPLLLSTTSELTFAASIARKRWCPSVFSVHLGICHLISLHPCFGMLLFTSFLPIFMWHFLSFELMAK